MRAGRGKICAYAIFVAAAACPSAARAAVFADVGTEPAVLFVATVSLVLLMWAAVAVRKKAREEGIARRRIGDLDLRLNEAEAAIAAEAHVLVIWRGRQTMPDRIAGGMHGAAKVPAKPEELVDFAGWLDPASAAALTEAVRGLRERKIEFMPTPSTYYDMLPNRLQQLSIGSIDENVDVLRELEILVDGDGPHSYLLQIFLREASGLYHEPQAGPFFFEIIQRKGDEGFGAGNFRALFESIERMQSA